MQTYSGQGTRVSLLSGLRPFSRSGAVRDAVAGVTLASMNIPQVLGYTRIAAMPVVTGLYTVLLPTCGVRGLRFLAPSWSWPPIRQRPLYFSGSHCRAWRRRPARNTWRLSVWSRCSPPGFLFLAWVFKLGFLADFLSHTVLVGFLTGVGFQVGIAMLGDMLGSHDPFAADACSGLGDLAGSVADPRLRPSGYPLWSAGSILLGNRIVPRLPFSLFAVVGTIAASATFDFAEDEALRSSGRFPAGCRRLAYPT